MKEGNSKTYVRPIPYSAFTDSILIYLRMLRLEIVEWGTAFTVLIMHRYITNYPIITNLIQ